ncbi:MAG: hypothetical protein HYT79_05800 [Elusimicrobia bacterium]|nr:hypothetical protein [Elusimicrobiota bacterium]
MSGPLIVLLFIGGPYSSFGQNAEAFDDADELDVRFDSAGRKGKRSSEKIAAVPVHADAGEEENREQPEDAHGSGYRLWPDAIPPRPLGGRALTTIEDHRIEASGDYYWPIFRVGLRAGMISGTNLLGGPSIPYATLQPSPYVTGTVSAESEGPVLYSMAAVTGSYLYLRSEPSIRLPYDSNSRGAIEEHAGAGHFYGDAIPVIRFARNVAMAPFAGVEAWALSSADSQMMLDGNVGLAAAWRFAPSHTVHAWGQVEGTLSRADSYRNVDGPNRVSDFNGQVYLEGVSAGADYTHTFGHEDYLRPWVQYTNRNVYHRVDTGMDLGLGPVTLAMAGRFQDTNSPWFVGERGGAVSVQWRPLEDLGLGVTGSVMERRDYEDNSLPYGFNVVGGVTWTPGENASGVSVRRTMVRQVHDDPEAEGIIARGQEYSNTGDYEDSFRNAVGKSRDFDAFAGNLPVAGVGDILRAVSLMTRSLNDIGYNHTEGEVLNAGNTPDIYSGWRGVYLSADEEDRAPVAICIGAAQLASELAERLGQRLGIAIEADPVSTVDNKPGGHAVPMIRIPGEGIVFVDWGTIVPTNTFDPQAALAVYQGRAGSVAVLHTVGDSSDRGAYAGRIYPEQGRALFDATTLHGEPGLPRSRGREFFNDEARGSDLTRRRALNALDRSLVGPF